MSVQTPSETVTKRAAATGVKTIPDVLHDVVARRGSALAVSSPEGCLSYAELAEASQALAQRLLDALPPQAPADGPITLLAPASVASVVATMAIIMTGRPYVVLDTQLPIGRLEQIQDISRSVACLAAQEFLERAQAVEGLPLVLVLEEQLAAARSAGVAPARTPATIEPSSTANIVFTSGSTGVPKGVVHSHAFLVEQAWVARDHYGIQEGARVGLVLPAAFVGGTTTLFGALLCGASLHVYDPRERGARNLPAWLRDEGVTSVTLTPSLLRSTVKALGSSGGLPELRYVGCGGEAVQGSDVRATWDHLCPDIVFVVGYGSSETCTATAYRFDPGSAVPDGGLPAGYAVRGKHVEVVDEHGRPVPAGTTGTLRITADVLSDGYVNLPDGASNPFATGADGRPCFHLNDRARKDEDGLVHVLGRADDAVKVRGYLVEPAEVESALRSLDDVAEAAVLAVRTGDTASLVGYVVPGGAGRTPAPAELRRALRARMPEWMVPADLVILPSLPRNERGKVDRAALPRPTRPPYAAPNGSWEVGVAALWMAVLGRDDVGRDESFIALGADSLTVEELLVRVQEAYGVALTTAQVAEAPTVRELALLLESASGSRAAPGVGARRERPARSSEVVALRRTGTRVPLFAFAGAGAAGQVYLPLCDALGDDQPVYALQPHALEGRGLPDLSIGMAARRYVRRLREIQPHGPYFLAGHSMGGLVALAVAQLLAAQGEEVLPVTLIDTGLPRRAAGASTPPPAEVSGGAEWPGIAHTGPAPSTTKADLWRIRGRLLLAGSARLPLEEAQRNFFELGMRVSMLHRPKPWSGPVHFVRSHANPQHASAWTSVLTGSVRVTTFPTDHNSMLRAPFVAQIAADLQEVATTGALAG